MRRGFIRLRPTRQSHPPRRGYVLHKIWTCEKRLGQLRARVLHRTGETGALFRSQGGPYFIRGSTPCKVFSCPGSVPGNNNTHRDRGPLTAAPGHRHRHRHHLHHLHHHCTPGAQTDHHRGHPLQNASGDPSSPCAPRPTSTVPRGCRTPADRGRTALSIARVPKDEPTDKYTNHI